MSNPPHTTEPTETPVPNILQETREAITAEHRAKLQNQIHELHAADAAEILELLKPEERHKLITLLNDELKPEILSELEEGVLADILPLLAPEKLAPALATIASDDALALVEGLDETRRRNILDRVPLRARSDIERGLDYPIDSAGRLMQRDLVAVPAFWSVGRVIDHLRQSAELPKDFYEIYIVSPTWRLIGSVLTSRLVRAKREESLNSLMQGEPLKIEAHKDREDVAEAFRRYNLVSAPVVDQNGMLMGMITADDIVEVITEEASEDIKRLGGVGRDRLSGTVLESARRRFLWLFVNLMTAILASVVIALFEDAIAGMVALAVLMPIVASMGGVAGIQTLTVAVRALATRELVAANQRRIIMREIGVGVLNGVSLAVILGVIGGAWFKNFALGMVLFAAVIVNMLTAALAGILIPLALEKIGADPAISSGVFLTTVTDVVGFFAFLGLAAYFLL